MNNFVFNIFVLVFCVGQMNAIYSYFHLQVSMTVAGTFAPGGFMLDLFDLIDLYDYESEESDLPLVEQGHSRNQHDVVPPGLTRYSNHPRTTSLRHIDDSPSLEMPTVYPRGHTHNTIRQEFDRIRPSCSHPRRF